MPVGSRREGIFAEASDRLRRSFTAACMSWVPALTPPAAKAMQTQMVHFRATLMTSVGSAQGNPQAEPDCYSKHLIIHSETNS